jgi:putative phosphoesterase
MVKIALISDSHGYIDHKALPYLGEADEIWHAGDIGDLGVLDILPKNNLKRIVTGNIDDSQARALFPETLEFEIEGMKVLILHIGGKPGKYAKGVKEKISQAGANLFVCGHSHICQVQYDEKLKCLFMNPGAVGNQGFHHVKTMLVFEIESGKVRNLRAIELGKRGAL